MSYSTLYNRVQSEKPKISTRWLRDQVIDLTEINSIIEQWTGVVDADSIRGWYVEGPQGSPVVLKEKESLIVLARSLTKDWRRIVYTKELMHTFDAPDEKTDTPEKFDKLTERFGDPSADLNAMYRAEAKAFWRALAVLCPEKYRLEQQALFKANETSLDVVAARLRIPSQFVGDLFREDFIEIVQNLK